MCQFAIDGHCLVSSMMASMPIPLDVDTCATCRKQDEPMGPNRVTCSRAIYFLKQEGLEVDKSLTRCVEAPIYGAGTELDYVISVVAYFASWVGLRWIFEKSAKCGCYAARDKMNAVGLIACREQAWTIAEAVVAKHAERFPFMRYVKKITTPLCYLLVRYAIHRAKARQSQRSNCSESSAG